MKYLIIFLILISCDNSERKVQKSLERCADDNVQYTDEFTQTSYTTYNTVQLTHEERLAKTLEYKKRQKEIDDKFKKLIQLAKDNNGIANTGVEIGYIVYGKALDNKDYFSLLVAYLNNIELWDLNRNQKLRLKYARIKKFTDIRVDQIEYLRKSTFEYFENLKPPYEEKRSSTTEIATKQELKQNLKKLLRSSLKNKMTNNSYDITYTNCVNFKKSQPERFKAKYQ